MHSSHIYKNMIKNIYKYILKSIRGKISKKLEYCRNILCFVAGQGIFNILPCDHVKP